MGRQDGLKGNRAVADMLDDIMIAYTEHRRRLFPGCRANFVEDWLDEKGSVVGIQPVAAPIELSVIVKRCRQDDELAQPRVCQQSAPDVAYVVLKVLDKAFLENTERDRSQFQSPVASLSMPSIISLL